MWTEIPRNTRLLSRRIPSISRNYSSSSGYQSIGSFHSENPEEALRIPKASYQTPLLPFDEETPTSFDSHGRITTDFMLDLTRWTYLNHGAFGAALTCGYSRAEQWRYFLEKQPLRYFDRELLPHLVYSTRRLADFCGLSSPTSLALLPNVTSGLNAAIGGYARHYGSSSRVVLWETSYGSVKKMARVCCNGVDEISFLSKLQATADAEGIILQALQRHLETEKDWTNSLLVLDQTASNTAINFPIQKLAAIAKDRGMIVLVDGAHGLLAQPNDTWKENVDIYLSNGHKWLSCPRGVAMMYCSSLEMQETVLRYPAVVSHGVDDGFFSRFVWDGTRDYAAALALPVVLDYWKDPDVMRTRIKEKLHQAVTHLAREWHGNVPEEEWPGVVTLVPMELHSPMALVRLPAHINSCQKMTSTDAKRIQDFLYDNFVEVPIKSIHGTLYVRLSCHVYNEFKDYERLGQVLLQYPKL